MAFQNMYEEEEEDEPMRFESLEKAAVLKRCEIFKALPLDCSACVEAITDVLYLISTQDQLTVAEATDLFFQSTQLLQSDNMKLRRLLCILIKEIGPLVPESFVASNSLLLDVNNGTESGKCNSFRALQKVMDSSLVGSIDRVISEWMMSSSSKIVTTALVGGLHLSQSNPALTKRWVTNLSEIMRDNSKAQYPAIALIHKSRKNDRLSVERLIQVCRQGKIRSPLAICLLIKMCTELMREDFTASSEIYKFVASLMNHSSDLVEFEACKAIFSLRNIPKDHLKPAVISISKYLSSILPVVRFATIRLLSNLSSYNPDVVSSINSDIERLVTDDNRIISTLAINALLKTGSEVTISLLLSQLSFSGFLSELSDEFKIVIVDSMCSLNAKFPSKYDVILSFLCKALNEEGSSLLKQKIVDTIMEIGKSNPESNELTLTQLAEFIDDCEFAQITKQVLLYLGLEVPSCKCPQKFVRYIYNHATIEKAEVRVVAVSTLAKIAARVPSLRRSIVALLKRCCKDTDDQVSERAMLYTKLFLTNDEALINRLILEVTNTVLEQRPQRTALKSKILIAGESEGKNDWSASVQPDAADPLRPNRRIISNAIIQGREALQKIKQLQALGIPSTSIDPIPLTDPDNEYIVSVMKHAYPSYLILQFIVKNTMDNISFHNVAIQANVEELEVTPSYAIPIEKIEPGATEYAYIVLQYVEHEYPSGTIECSFRFSTLTDDTDTPNEDEYPLEHFDVDIHDFISPVELGNSFGEKWAQMSEEETSCTYSLDSMRNLTVAAHELANFFGMAIVGGVPEKITTTSHLLQMSGKLSDSVQTLILVEAKVFITTENAVALQLSLRGGHSELREYLANALLS